jgi:DNA-binding SARP family transcriptional activator/tetratricopeptide (TPR) repeat protein
MATMAPRRGDPAAAVGDGGGLWVDVLGPLDVRAEGRPVPVPSGKSAVVLAVLAMSAGRPVSIERLADHLWRDELPERVRGSLHSHVTRLRRLLGAEAIRTVPSGYLLDIDPDRVDVLRFRRLVADAAGLDDTERTRELLDQALRVWRGEPLSGLGSSDFELDEVPLLVEERLAALQRRVELDLAAGRHAEVVAELRDQTARHPLREPLWHQLITALTGSGRQAEAIEAYHDLRARLRDQLGVDPSAELQQLYRRLLAGEVAGAGDVSGAGGTGAADRARVSPAMPRPLQQPADIDRFTGRRAELATLDRLLDEQPPTRGSSLVVALVGTAGAGKTALAVHWSHRVIDRFPGGQLYVDLYGYGPAAPNEPASVLDAFLRALGTPPAQVPADLDARAALFRTATTGRGLLVVADNARDTDHVRPLLPGPGNLLLVTSRSQLRGLTAREGAHRVTVAQLPAADAADLLARVLGTARAAAEPGAVADLVERCARLPLALTIAAERAARQPDVPVAALVEELRDEQSRLDSLATGEDVATDMRAVLSWSYRHLDPEVARSFRRLGLHPGGGEHSLAVAAALTGLGARAVRAHLDRLVAVHLLEQRHPDRYAFHDLLRAYAAERARAAEAPGERQAAVVRALDWYLHTATAAVALQWYGTRRYHPVDLPPLSPHVAPARFDSSELAQGWLEANRATLIAVAREAAAQRRDLHASMLVEVTRRFLFHRSYWHDLAHLTRIGLPVARRRGDRVAEADLVRDLGITHALLRDYRRATASFQESFELSVAAGYRSGEAQSLHDLSNVCVCLGRGEEALAYRRREREVCQEIGDRLGEALALNSMAMDHLCLGQHRTSILLCQQALGMLAGSDDVWRPRALGHVLDSLGQAHAALGRHREAIDAYRQALEAIEGLADPRGDAVIRLHLGRSLHRAGDPDGALANWRQALATLTGLRDPLADDALAEIEALEAPLRSSA